MNKWKNEKLKTGKKIINISIDLWTKEDILEWTDTLYPFGISKTLARKILSKVSRHWRKKLHQQIWNPRCEKIQEYKISSLKGKGKEVDTNYRKLVKKSLEEGNQSRSQEKGKKVVQAPRNTRRKKTNLARSQEVTQNTDLSPVSSYLSQETSFTDKLKKILWDKIKEGKKWLGI